jgi:hypothetical protein
VTDPCDRPMPEDPSGRPYSLCPPAFVHTRSRTYLMWWLVSTLVQDYDDGLSDSEWDTLSDLRARLNHAVHPAGPDDLKRRAEHLDWTHRDYEHSYTASGPVIRWSARLKGDPDAPWIPFRRGMHPASAKVARLGLREESEGLWCTNSCKCVMQNSL